MIYGALEAGGTKMVCAILSEEKGEIQILNKVSIPTDNPEITMPRIVNYFLDWNEKQSSQKISALGIATFGPVGLNKSKADYGKILKTPKEGWQGFPMLDYLESKTGLKAAIDTDVNGSCLGEVYYTRKGEKIVRRADCDIVGSALYITVGTGIGAGMVIDGKPIHGMLHPEAGHMLISPLTGDENNCICPFHKGCLEGLASGPAIMHRTGVAGNELLLNDSVWELEAEYLSIALSNMILAISPQKVILGGGVMHQKQLFTMIRRKVEEKLGGYLSTDELKNMENYIVPAELGDDQGIVGCMHLAMQLI